MLLQGKKLVLKFASHWIKVNHLSVCINRKKLLVKFVLEMDHFSRQIIQQVNMRNLKR